jgi:transcriptional regulator with XRE-family HTH domain
MKRSSLCATEKDINRQIGLRLRQARCKRGLTLQKLGAALGVSHQQIQKYETGADCLSAAKVVRLAEILGVKVSHFYDAPVRADLDD